MKAAKRKANYGLFWGFILNSQNSCRAAWSVIRNETSLPKRNTLIPISPDELNNFFINFDSPSEGNTRVPDNFYSLLIITLIKTFPSNQ